MPVVIGDDYLNDVIANYRNELDEKLYDYFKSIGFNGDYIHLGSRHLMNKNDDVKDDDSEVQDHIKVFKSVFNTNDKNLRIALWNNMYVDFDLISNKYREYITDEEYQFLKEFDECKCLGDKYNYDFFNINDEFESFNIKFVPVKIDRNQETINPNLELLFNHFKNDGDYEKFAFRSCENIDIYHFFPSNLSFYICLKDNTCIGFISLDADSLESGYRFTDEKTVASLSFYIFKEYRGKGYCNEAIWLMSDLAFKNKLLVPIETIRKNVFNYVPADIVLLTATVSVDNESSKKVLLLSDFVKEGTIHKYAKIDNCFIDVYYYELTKELYLDLEKHRNSAIELYGKEMVFKLIRAINKYKETHRPRYITKKDLKDWD